MIGYEMDVIMNRLDSLVLRCQQGKQGSFIASGFERFDLASV
jgi:hypothetical protein